MCRMSPFCILIYMYMEMLHENICVSNVYQQRNGSTIESKFIFFIPAKRYHFIKIRFLIPAKQYHHIKIQVSHPCVTVLLYQYSHPSVAMPSYKDACFSHPYKTVPPYQDSGFSPLCNSTAISIFSPKYSSAILKRCVFLSPLCNSTTISRLRFLTPV